MTAPNNPCTHCNRAVLPADRYGWCDECLEAFVDDPAAVQADDYRPGPAAMVNITINAADVPDDDDAGAKFVREEIARQVRQAVQANMRPAGQLRHAETGPHFTPQQLIDEILPAVSYEQRREAIAHRRSGRPLASGGVVRPYTPAPLTPEQQARMDAGRALARANSAADERQSAPLSSSFQLGHGDVE